MPTMIFKNVKTVWVDDKPFNIPNTDISIWKIKLEIDGEQQLYSTMSKALANMGFQGDVELYTNDKGKEYVRQAPKQEEPATAQPKKEWKSDDEFWSAKDATIKAQWAIGQAVSITNTVATVLGENLNNDQMASIETTAKALFAMVDRVAQDPNDVDIINMKDIPL